jgi:hypothetical protein
VGVNPHLFNPFAPKSDSGFISPACNSNNHSASSEDSAENHEERVAAASVISEDDEQKFRRDSDEVDETDRHNEVTQLLSGGIIETQFGELMMSARNETPTPPVEDSGTLALYCRLYKVVFYVAFMSSVSSHVFYYKLFSLDFFDYFQNK